ncbi:PH domain-containing protein [Neolewinella aurantiaca]|uniref:PH domain-containing protein n=1 Tax=Neolewinella aurantiaca TaxID=2602767 RepID=A0A5C7FHV1_9BACT|nr:PH domain-containing protein [Neolewinella aurantiaca]TXF90715.1 PH domain-containing protein [Neolewinella aurantiaca]
MEYRESQKFNQWWLWLLNLVIFVALAITGFNAWSNGADLMASVVGPLSMALVMILLATIELRTVINEDGIEVKFWPFGRRRIFRSEIKNVRVRKYSPLREFGGWGYRIGPAGKAFNMQGNMGLQLEMKDGERLLIGTRQPDKLAAWLENWLQSADEDELADELRMLKLKTLRKNKLPG